MPSQTFDIVLELAMDQYGYITTDDARARGIDPHNLRNLAHRGDAERIAHGLYRLNAVPHTGHEQLMEATLWPRGHGVISHDTALDLWDLCDVNPAKVHVTVPHPTRIRRHIPPAFVVHRRHLDSTDITRLEGIPVVTVRRAILDGIERHLGGHLIDQAIDTARSTGALRGRDLDTVAQARTDR